MFQALASGVVVGQTNLALFPNADPSLSSHVEVLDTTLSVVSGRPGDQLVFRPIAPPSGW